MAALGVKRFWSTRPDHPSAPDVPLFRVLARRWKPLTRVESNPVPMPHVTPTGNAPPLSRASFQPRAPIYARDTSKIKPVWNPWLWMK
jgi:hypothetical protein